VTHASQQFCFSDKGPCRRVRLLAVVCVAACLCCHFCFCGKKWEGGGQWWLPRHTGVAVRPGRLPSVCCLFVCLFFAWVCPSSCEVK